MSEYKVGDKFVVEIAEVYDELFNEVDLYRMKGFNALVFDKNGLDKLQMYEEEQIPYTVAYEKGLKDVWELAKRIVLSVERGGLDGREIEHVFNANYWRKVFEEYTPQEALAKLESYEKEQEEIKVGDVVEGKLENIKGVVLKKICEYKYYILFRDGSAGARNLEELKKTGKYIDVKNILKQISED